ncbi:50S ribosomal protein L4 [Ectothiorhodospiraceae bacterium BW-2]|nr:50S ribosomal protein L4 [Ectothiorhodospiraceae bacterium BW-2]
MQIELKSLDGTSAAMVELSAAVFERDFNEPLIHQVVTAYLAGARQGTKAQKNRSAVSGGGSKPWRQKGTGRARSGTIRSPIWRGGGKTFAATNRDHSQKVNRKMYRAAMCSILSELVRQERLIVVEDINLAEPKTKLLLEQIAGLNLSLALIVNHEVSPNLYLSARNLPHIAVCDTVAVNPVDLVGYEQVVMTTAAVKAIEEKLA